MNNLFSVFDPTACLSLPLNWLSMVIIIFLVPFNFWARKSSVLQTIKTLTLFLHNEFKAMFGSLSVPGLSLIPISLLLFIMCNNFLGLFPYVFTASSHLPFATTLAIPLWLGHMTFFLLKHPNHAAAHLVPLGTPAPLMPFMVIIELVSSLIRPLTLSVRLVANMVAGHLLLTLLSSQTPGNSVLVISLTLAALVLLSVLETAVALIQAYVFSVLSALYFNEANI